MRGLADVTMKTVRRHAPSDHIKMSQPLAITSM